MDIDAQAACDSRERHLVNGSVKLGHAAARSGEWAQHFSNASCSESNLVAKCFPNAWSSNWFSTRTDLIRFVNIILT